jgi:hypothetical protein
MLGLIAVGIAVVRARRWRGLLRWLPLASSLLIPVDLVAMALLGPWPEIVVRASYMALSYAALGLVLALRPEDAQPPADLRNEERLAIA